MAQKFGIDNLKLLVKSALGLTGQLVDDLDDGKLQFTEQLGLIGQLVQGIAVAKVWPAIKQELAELSTAEKKQLREYLIAEFKLTNVSNAKAVDALIKSTLAFAISGWEVAEGWKAVSKK